MQAHIFLLDILLGFAHCYILFFYLCWQSRLTWLYLFSRLTNLLNQELKSGDITELLEVVLSNNYFTLENKTHQQNHGLTMSSSVSAIWLFCSWVTFPHIESTALNSLGTRVGFYARYVDDLFLLARSREEAEYVQGIFNNTKSHNKFYIEHPSNASDINMLKWPDISIHIIKQGVSL